MKTIHWGMIGCGDVAEIKSGPGFYKAEHSCLHAVTNRTLARAQSYAQRHGVPHVYPDVATLLADAQIDAVYIATPPADHMALCLQAAAAGKHVYVEKPMGMTYAECEAMMAACRQAGVRLYVAFYRRALPRFLQVKSWLDEGRIGRVCSVSVMQRKPVEAAERDPATLPWRLRAELAGGGKFVDIGVHVLDLFSFWFGPISAAQGQASNRGGFYSVEDTVVASWTHANGVVGSGAWCFVSQDAEDRVDIIGTEGRIELAFFDDSPLRLITAQGTQMLDMPNPPHVQQPLIQSIVDELNGQSTSNADTPAAANVSAVIDSILQDYRRHSGTQN